MDNSQKALQMAFAAFLFVIAATTAIFLYTKLMSNAKRIMTFSDNNHTFAEYVDFENVTSYDRVINRDEIVMTILDIENNTSYINEIRVGTYKFRQTDTQEDIKSDLVSWLNSSGGSTYRSTYDEENKILIYSVNH